MKICVDENNVITAIVYHGDVPDGIEVMSMPDGVDVLTHKYIDGSFVENPDYTPYEPTEPENVLTQDDYNMDFDYRLSCLELGL